MAVNVSTRQLSNPAFANTVHTALDAAQMPPDALCLELTESHLLEAASAAPYVLDLLGSDGVHISLDDFGTGYSSLSYLTRLPVDKLKIDRSFVSGLGDGGHDTTVVQAIIGLADALGLVTVAEGVETEEQAAILTDLGCTQAQGYLFGKPVVAGLVDDLFAETEPSRRRFA
jgi:EAL domain-containing protein (putative c-di-GMP-specific phosphodiesterase class I)